MNSFFRGSQFFLEPGSSPWKSLSRSARRAAHTGALFVPASGDNCRIWGQLQTPPVPPGSLGISWEHMVPGVHLTVFLDLLILSLSLQVCSGSTGVCPGRAGGTWILQGTQQAVELLISVISAHLETSCHTWMELQEVWSQ